MNLSVLEENHMKVLVYTLRIITIIAGFCLAYLGLCLLGVMPSVANPSGWMQEYAPHGAGSLISIIGVVIMVGAAYLGRKNS